MYEIANDRYGENDVIYHNKSVFGVFSTSLDIAAGEYVFDITEKVLLHPAAVSDEDYMLAQCGGHPKFEIVDVEVRPTLSAEFERLNDEMWRNFENDMKRRFAQQEQKKRNPIVEFVEAVLVICFPIYFFIGCHWFFG